MGVIADGKTDGKETRWFDNGKKTDVNDIDVDEDWEWEDDPFKLYGLTDDERSLGRDFWE